eukprot:9472265-Pyramimonas_sp.AAC.1
MSFRKSVRMPWRWTPGAGPAASGGPKKSRGPPGAYVYAHAPHRSKGGGESVACWMYGASKHMERPRLGAICLQWSRHNLHA